MSDILGGIEVRQARYQDLRPLILTGDALVWAGSTALQHAIRWWDKPSGSTLGLSHASLVIRPSEYECWRDRVFTVEATGAQGLHPAILSAQLLKEHGRCFHISTTLTDAQRSTIAMQALIDACSGIAYDFGGCFYNILGRTVEDAAKYFCSEYVAGKWMQVGYIAQGPAPIPNELPGIAPRPCVITEIIMKDAQ